MSYGAVDYFGISNGSTIVVQSGEYSPSYTTDATVSDENGDFRCRTKAGQVDEYSCTYKLCGGGDTNNDRTLDSDADLANDTTNDRYLKIGTVYQHNTKNLQITGIEVSTTNSEEPTLTITGIDEASGKTHAEYTSGITVRCKKQAQTFGLVALATGNYVTSGSIEISGSHSVVEDSDGDIVCREPYGFRLSASNTIQNCTATPTATADTANGFFLDSPIGQSDPNTDYGTATVEVFKDLVKDAS